ncbi:MAG TPA: heavy metal translocating P-type ATPase [Deltaproteobacteria bacterium]|nr:heavy metal translocating P-type ATPase [Deltaproteobacteria bacterium]HQJ07773.1 heavy metal translocating P-type ATPase [Deltaproteobacteria bacterium]
MPHERQPAHPHDHHGRMIEDLRKRFFVSLILTFPVLLLSPTIRDFFGWGPLIGPRIDPFVLLFFSSIIFFHGGLPFLKGLRGELQQRQPGMMTLISLALSVAYAYSAAVVFGLPGMVFFWELATLIDVMLLGHWIEMRSISGASGALEELVKLMPSRANLIRKDGSIEEVPVDSLKKGDPVLVKPGEKVPIDGRITEGRTTMDESMITGESRPVEKGEGDSVIGGVINGESAVTIDVTKTGKDTYLSQVIDMVRRAQESRSRAQVLSDRAAFWLTIISLSVGSVTLITWLVLDKDFVFALARMVTVMVITCPHALGLAVPLVVAISTTLAARNGLLINDRSAFERARDIDAAVFDKTGTLTLGTFSVVNVITDEGWKPDSVLSLAAALESRSEHPIARAIVEKAQAGGLSLTSPKDFTIIPGRGAQATIDGRNIMVVSPGYLREKGIIADRPLMEAASEAGRTTVYVIEEGEVIGVIQLADTVRPESREAIHDLKSMGIEVMMLTGDSRFVAETVADDLGLDAYFAEVLPDQKAKKIKDLEGKGFRVAMVGDGVNDAPALAASDLGIAIGAGTDVAIESADIVLVRSDPRDVFEVLKLSRSTYRKMVQNLFWATAYNIVAIPLAAGVLYPWGFVLPPAAGAIAMTASTIIVAVNAQLLWRMRGKLRERVR